MEGDYFSEPIDLTYLEYVEPDEAARVFQYVPEEVPPAPPVPPRRNVREVLAKNWLFTWNNYPDVTAPQRWADVKFLAYQEEVAPQTGMAHLQGYVQFSKKKRMTQLKKMQQQVHWTKQNDFGGTAEDCASYANKEETRAPDGMVYRAGEITAERQRTDLANLAKEILSGKPLSQMVADHPSEAMRYSNGFKFLAQYAPPPPRIRTVDVRLYYGGTGLGKTYMANAEFPTCYIKGPDQWWQNYAGESEVVLDDFAGAGSHVTLAETLRMLDVYLYIVQIKTTSAYLRATTIIVTTNLHPLQWYDFEDRMSQYHALIRRFTLIREFTAPQTYTDHVPGSDGWLQFEGGVGYETTRNWKKRAREE